MPQKNTIFARKHCDFEFIKRFEYSHDRARQEEFKDAKGWTQLDEALDEAAWAVDHKFASGSEGGQPHSMACRQKSSGERYREGPGGALLMDAFWHQGQSKLQEKEPLVRATEPGWKWWSGFFSMGLADRDEMAP